MLRDTIQTDQITALKQGDKFRLDVLRFILAQIKNKEIEKKESLNDEETIILIKKAVKELRESADAFAKGNRSDLVDHNNKQFDILSAYLPAELSDEELETRIRKILDDNREAVSSNPKSAIGICMKSLRSEADAGRIMAVLAGIQKSNA